MLSAQNLIILRIMCKTRLLKCTHNLWRKGMNISSNFQPLLGCHHSLTHLRMTSLRTFKPGRVLLPWATNSLRTSRVGILMNWMLFTGATFSWIWALAVAPTRPLLPNIQHIATFAKRLTSKTAHRIITYRPIRLPHILATLLEV